MKQVILSFDYELFFGIHSGTVEKTIIEPTKRMLAGLEDVGASATFFVDYLMLKFLKKANTKRTLADLTLLEQQLADIVSRGHRIELHIHPHWVDARYNGDGTWDFSDYSHYCLTSFSISEIEEMFKEGVSILNSIAQQVVPAYQVVAFRAGGWVVQPFSLLKSAFIKAGIRIDSSVAPGCKHVTINYTTDFTNISNKDYYCFSDFIEEEVSNGLFIEVPITTYYYGIIDKIRHKCSKLLHYSQFKKVADGTHFRYSDKSVFSGPSMFSLAWVAPSIVARKLKNSSNQIVTIIDHPKDFAAINIITLKKIAKNAVFITYADLIKK